MFTPLNKPLKLPLMSLRKFVPLLIALSAVSVTGAFAQTAAPNTEFRITKVTPEFQDTPTGPSTYNKKSTRPQKWLEIEATFDWQPRLKEPKYLDEVTVNYYILLNNKGLTTDKEGTLLTGTVVHTDVGQGRDLHSSIFVSPRTLERLFDGRPPTNPAQAIVDVAVTVSQGGQVVADYSLKSKGAWWTNPLYKPTPGIALTKPNTPFANAAWDYFEPIKEKAQ